VFWGLQKQNCVSSTFGLLHLRYAILITNHIANFPSPKIQERCRIKKIALYFRVYGSIHTCTMESFFFLLNPPYYTRYSTFILAPILRGIFSHIYKESISNLATFNSFRRATKSRFPCLYYHSLLPSSGLQDDWFTLLMALKVGGISRYIKIVYIDG